MFNLFLFLFFVLHLVFIGIQKGIDFLNWIKFFLCFLFFIVFFCLKSKLMAVIMSHSVNQTLIAYSDQVISSKSKLLKKERTNTIFRIINFFQIIGLKIIFT